MKRCVSSFVTADGRALAAGELVEDNDPIIRGREVFFTGMEVSVADAEKPTPEVDDTPAEDEINVPPHIDPPVDPDEDDEDEDEGEGRSDEPTVEEATAAPGEKRNTARSRKP